jgi:hypothetical protein
MRGRVRREMENREGIKIIEEKNSEGVRRGVFRD